MREPVLSGQITNEGMLSVIQEIERRRTTGVLTFEHGDVRGEVDLIAGQFALEQPEMPDGADPVEALLQLRSGEYWVHQRLPPLPVSKGDDLTRTGSLAVHVPVDLMQFCEHAGMTGTLALENDEGRRAQIVYDQGDLIGIRVDGSDEEDLHQVFGWEHGSFRIHAQTVPPPVEPEAPQPAAAESHGGAAPGAPARSDETAQHFLASVEVALTKIVEEREKRRSPSRTSPSQPPLRPTRPSELPAAGVPGKQGKRPPTVQVVYLGAHRGQGTPEQGVRHVRGDIRPEGMLPEASAERRSKDQAKPTGEVERAAMEGSGATTPLLAAESTAKPAMGRTFAWVVVVIALMVAALAVLAQLPAIE